MCRLMKLLALAGLGGLPLSGQAQTMAEQAAVFPQGLPFDHSGHIDLGYSHLSGSGKFVGGANNRVFDSERNTLNLQAFDLTLFRLPASGLGALVNLTVGKDADVIAAYGTIDKTRGPSAGANKRFDVTQGYVHYANEGFTVIAGKYVTLAGAEVIKGPSNVNYSRAILFGYAIPFTHTGVRASYLLNEQLSLTAGINNGWDAFQDINGNKTWELAFTYTPGKTFSLAGVAYIGKEQAANYPVVSPDKGTRQLIDLVATYQPSEQLTLVLNYDHASQTNVLAGGGTVRWEGWAGYASYQIDPRWRLSLRGEWFHDKDGYRTGVGESGQKWKEATLTLAYLPDKNWELRAELRADKSDRATFLATDGVTARDRQNSVGLQALYKF